MKFTLWEETGKKSEVYKGAIEMRDNEPDCVADVSILSKLGNWEPITWKKGLKEMIESMKLSCGCVWGGGNSL